MSRSDVARYGGAESVKLACCKVMWLDTKCRRQHKACMSQGNVARHGGCRRQHKACMSQDDVARHDGAEGDTRAMWLGTMVPKATQGSHVARRCD
ncbi:unnamed protein product [Prunus armeniaca]